MISTFSSKLKRYTYRKWKKENYTHTHTHTYKHVQVTSNDIQDKQIADKQTTCSEPTNWFGFEWMDEWMNEWMNGWMDPAIN